MWDLGVVDGGNDRNSISGVVFEGAVKDLETMRPL